MAKGNKDLENARNIVKPLFDLMGITRVILVDDDYEISLNSIMNLAVQVDNIAQSPIADIAPALSDLDPLEDSIAFREILQYLLDDEKISLEELHNMFSTQTSQSVNEIEPLFADYEFLPLSPANWEQNLSDFLDNSVRSKTLFLFDLRLSDDSSQDGLRIISGLLTRYNDVICGLISSTFEPGNDEHQKWVEYTSDTSEFPNLDRNRFALLSKNHRSYSGRLPSLKRIVLNEHAHKFIEIAIDHINSATVEAINMVKSLDIYDLETMVFQSSYKEGVWEFDTLSRILNIIQRDKLIAYSKDSDRLNIVADQMRKITDIRTQKPKKITDIAKQIRVSELYDEEEIINHYHLPLELGDIFTIKYKDSEKQYILLTQPCDLMVREEEPEGARARENGILAEITESGLSDPLLTYEIEHLREKKSYVNFKNYHVANLSILDLVVFNHNGQASFIEGKLPDAPGLIESWKRRHKILEKYFKSSIANFNTIKHVLATSSEVNTFDPITLLPQLSNTLNVVPTITDNSISFPVRRVKRLRQPFAGSLLTKYASSTARDAFEHDFTTIRENDKE